MHTATNKKKTISLIRIFIISLRLYLGRGPGSVVGIATGYGLEGRGIESRWGEIFRTSSDRPWALGPTQSPVQWVPGLSRGKEWPGRDADPSHLLVPWSRKSRVLPLLLLWAVRPVCTASVPIQGCTLPLYLGLSSTIIQVFRTQICTDSSLFLCMPHNTDNALSLAWWLSHFAKIQVMKLLFTRFLPYSYQVPSIQY